MHDECRKLPLQTIRVLCLSVRSADVAGIRRFGSKTTRNGCVCPSCSGTRRTVRPGSSRHLTRQQISFRNIWKHADLTKIQSSACLTLFQFPLARRKSLSEAGVQRPTMLGNCHFVSRVCHGLLHKCVPQGKSVYEEGLGWLVCASTKPLFPLSSKMLCAFLLGDGGGSRKSLCFQSQIIDGTLFIDGYLQCNYNARFVPCSIHQSQASSPPGCRSEQIL